MKVVSYGFGLDGQFDCPLHRGPASVRQRSREIPSAARTTAIPGEPHGGGLAFLRSAVPHAGNLDVEHMRHVLLRLLPREIALAVLGSDNSLMRGGPSAQFTEDQINADASFDDSDVQYLYFIRNCGACTGAEDGVVCRNKVSQLIAAAARSTCN